MDIAPWIILIHLLATATGFPKLACKDRQEIDPKDRRCRKACRTDADCVSNKKVCQCDGSCGYSCINPNLRCVPELVSFANGTVRVTPENRFGAVAQYECNDGFVLRGPEARVCQGDENWSQHEPTCIVDHSISLTYECGTPPPVFNAQHDGPQHQTSFPLGAMLEYRCKPGYTLSRDSVVRAWCVGGGVWVGPNMTCTPNLATAGCPLLEGIENGFVDTDPPSGVGSVATYHCMVGFHLAGRAERTCGPDGTWEGIPPSCEKVTCGQPPVVEHANHDGLTAPALYPSGHQLEYTCEYGYYQDGDSRAMCSGEGVWIGLTLTCSPRNCGFPGDLENGWRTGYSFTYPNKVNYFCYDGFDLRGFSFRTCQASGIWDNAVPTCEPVSCPVLQAPAFGTLLGSGTRYGTELRFECKKGFRIKGAEVRRCMADRTWSGEPTLCEEINCGWPGPFYNGYLIGSSTNVGDTIFFSCDVRTTSDGSAFDTTCQENGEWSSPVPTCWGQCLVPQIANATLDSGREMAYVNHGSSITFRCMEGLQPLDKSSMLCNNGTWTSQPQCVPAPCLSLPPPVYKGYRIFLGRDHGYKAKYKCFPGYRLKGMNSSYLRCSYGEWVGGSPHCEEFFCPNPDPLQDGSVFKKVEDGRFTFQPYIRSIRHGDRLEYECNEGYRLSGPSGATCVDGQWRPSLTEPGSKCVPIVHPPFRKLWEPIQEREPSQ